MYFVGCKVSHNVGILRKLKFTLSQTCLLLLYNSLVLPYLQYCSIIWGCSSPNKLKSLIVLQKKAVRIIVKAEFRAHTTPLFKKCSLLKIMDICQFQIALFMFKFTISKLPSMFNSYFTYTSSIHHYSTRSSISGLAMPSVRMKIRQRSIKYQGPFVWNKLSTEIFKPN